MTVLLSFISMNLVWAVPRNFGSTGSVTWLSAERVRRLKPPGHDQQILLLQTADHLSRELAADALTGAMRARCLLTLGQTLTRVWSRDPPRDAEPVPSGVRRLEREANLLDALAREGAVLGLGMITAVLGDHAASGDISVESALGALEMLGRMRSDRAAAEVRRLRRGAAFDDVRVRAEQLLKVWHDQFESRRLASCRNDLI